MIEILERADAADYVPTFARHRITIETLCQMDEEDFKQVTIATCSSHSDYTAYDKKNTMLQAGQFPK